MKYRMVKASDLRMLKRFALEGISWKAGSISGAGSSREEQEIIERELKRLERLEKRIKKI